MTVKKPMTGWYNPVMLVQTGIRVAISTVFGQFADKREAFAAANAIKPQPFDSNFDYAGRSKDGDFWFDFIADTGDGWDPTYAMATLLAEDSLTPERSDQPLPRGRILVMGGDQVYPTASREDYQDRLIGPFDEAYAQGEEKRWIDEDRPDLYAIPGNHDWYDGLNAFFGIFCRRRIEPSTGIGIPRNGRIIGGRRTWQTRSYFAIRLPGNWWLWATDNQLEGYIDQPQIEYFQHVAKAWMAPRSKLILCVGEPSWEYVDSKNPKKKFANFSYLERLAGEALDDQEKWMGHQLKLVLTGDSHHYARYMEGERHYITCGGGGAFLHPTHQLESKEFDWEYPKPGIRYYPKRSKAPPYRRSFKIAKKPNGADALYPGRETSRALTKRNLWFAFSNWPFTVTLFAAYLPFNWLLHMAAEIYGRGSLVRALTGSEGASLLHALCTYLWVFFISPWPLVLVLAALGGYYYFADSPDDKLKRLRIGLVHWFIQAASVMLVTCLVVWSFGRALFSLEVAQFWAVTVPPLILILATMVAAFVSATIFGCYMWLNLNRYGRHWNEAFSSLRIAGFKCFLRLRIKEDGKLTVYPIGLENVPNGGGPPDRLHTHLIEKPIEIR